MKRQVVRGDGRLQRCKNKNLAAWADLENRAAAVANVQIVVVIERDACSDAHAFDPLLLRSLLRERALPGDFRWRVERWPPLRRTAPPDAPARAKRSRARESSSPRRESPRRAQLSQCAESRSSLPSSRTRISYPANVKREQTKV